MAQIHSTAIIDPRAKIGDKVDIGAYSLIHGNVEIGDNVKIGSFCELGVNTPLGSGEPLIIKEKSLIRSHSVFYESSSFGSSLITGHHVVVRENTLAGEGFQIGTFSEIQGDCSIGDFVRFQSNVFVGKKTVIGNYVWVLPYVVFTNDPTPPSDTLIGATIEDFVSIAADSVIMPGVRLGRHSLIAANACVTRDVPPGMLVAGVPARIVSKTQSVVRRDGSGEAAYPWTRHFHRGYPKSVVEKWESDFDEH